ncbi:MAG: hypothetical protein AAGK97_07555 [Bacteroidota bacterium]
MIRSVFIGILFLATLPLAGQQIVVSVDTNSMQIGDQNKLIFEIIIPDSKTFQGIGFEYLDSIINQTNPEAAIKEVFEVQDSSAWINEGTKKRKELTFTIWESGNYFIPPIPINYIDNGRLNQTFSRPINLIVTSPLEKTTAQDSIPLSPIKPIIETPINYVKFLLIPAALILGALLLIAGFGYFLYRILNKKKEVIRDPNYIFPHNKAMHKLHKIQNEKVWEQEDFKKFHTDVTYVIRDYLGDRFGINALEMTSGEIIRSLKERNELDTWVSELNKIFKIADMVKFAKAIPLYDIHKQTIQQCIDFVNNTKTEEIKIQLSEAEEANYPSDLLFKIPKTADSKS